MDGNTNTDKTGRTILIVILAVTLRQVLLWGGMMMGGGMGRRRWVSA